MDLTYAVKLDGAMPRDYCGLPQYLSPEQVSGQGHSVPADYWQLGILMHEMLLGDSPFVIDQGNNSEVAIYTRISAHQFGAKSLIRADADLSSEAKELIRALLHPDVNQRLGVTGRGAEAVRNHDVHGANRTRTALPLPAARSSLSTPGLCSGSSPSNSSS